MIDKLIEKLTSYKSHLYSFEQNGVILLDKQDPNKNEILDKIYQDANDILKVYKRDDIELNTLIKDALKQVAFSHNQGVVLIQKDKILLKGDIEREAIKDLMKLIFLENKNLNKFLHSSLTLHFSSIDIKFLSINELFNMDSIYKKLMSQFIKLLQNDVDIKERLKNSSIKIEELNKDNNESYKKIDLIVEKILRESFNKNIGVILNFMSDFLIKILATNSTLDIKVLKHFFEKEILKNSKSYSFTVIRQLSIARDKYLKLIDEANIKISETEIKADEFLKTQNIEEKKSNNTKKALEEVKLELNELEDNSKSLFKKRQKIKNRSSKKYLAISSEIKAINSEKFELDIKLKNLNSKYEYSKQIIINIQQDKQDYLKLLPELVKVQQNKIDEANKNLKEFESTYLNIKRFLIKILIEKKPNFDFEKLLQKIKQVRVNKELCNSIKDKQNILERRYDGLPIDEFENLKNQIFKNEDNFDKFITITTNQALNKELNFRKISNLEFMNSNVKVIQQYISIFLNKIIKNREEIVINGFMNFILRNKFNLILKIEAEKLLNLLVHENSNAQSFIDYFNGEIDKEIGGEYKRPELIDKNGKKISLSKVNSIIRKYRDYISFLTKKDEFIDKSMDKFIKLTTFLERNSQKNDNKIKLIIKQSQILERDLQIARNQKEKFLLSHKSVKEEFEDLITIVANVLHKRREKLI